MRHAPSILKFFSPATHNGSLGVRVVAAATWAASFCCGSAALSAAVTSEPVGVTSVALPAATDFFVTVPVMQPAAFAGQVSSVAGNVITVAGPAGWTGGQFVYTAGSQPSTYFVLIGSGAMEGRSFTIVANGAATLTLDLAGGNLNTLAVGDALRVVPYWTLGALFPPAAAGTSFTPTTVVGSPQTTLALYGSPAAGINGAPSATYFYFSGAWRQTGQSPSVSLNDQIVPPGAPLRLRNAPSGGVFVSAGAVVMHRLAFPIYTLIGGQQDTPLTLPRPVPVTLDGSGLLANGAFAVSPNPLTRADLLMVTDNIAAGINKAPSAYYLYYNAGWRKLGQPLTVDFGSDVVFDSSKSVVLRAAPSSDGAPRVWTHAPSY